MNKRTTLRLGGALVLGFAVSGCEVSGVGFGVSYGYNDPFYWNDYYYRRDIDIDVDVPDRPDRPDRPPNVKPTPPIAKPPVAKPPSVRPPTHKPARPSRPGGGGGRLR